MNKIRKLNSSYKREKACQEEQLFVPSEEKAIGMKWKSKPDPKADIARHTLTQSTFQYVPILSTLRSLFSQKEFRDMYFEYNTSHICSPHKFERFCCCKVYQTSIFFKNNPNALQLLLSTDDFDPGSAQKSKSGVNKTCAVYLHVHNVPQEFLSKDSNTYVVALCKTMNMKQEYTSLNNVLELIRNEFQILETDGICIGENLNLKGTLINVCCDNLGGKTLFGYAESFNTQYYCRICETEKCVCEEKWTLMENMLD